MPLKSQLDTLDITGDDEAIMLAEAYGEENVEWLIQARQRRRDEMNTQLAPIEEEFRQVHLLSSC